MTTRNDQTLPHDVSNSELRSVFDCLERLICDGLKHGHFRYEIKGIVGKGLRRELIIEAGVSHRFTIPVGELSN